MTSIGSIATTKTILGQLALVLIFMDAYVNMLSCIIDAQASILAYVNMHEIYLYRH